MEDKNIVCRICLKSSVDEMINIFDADNDLSGQIASCVGFELRYDENLPAKMCVTCNMLFKAALKFRASCKQSEEKLSASVMQEESQNLKPLLSNSEKVDKEISTSFSSGQKISEVSVEFAVKDVSEMEAEIFKTSVSTPEVPILDEIIPKESVINNDFGTRKLCIETVKPTNINNNSKDNFVCMICGNKYNDRFKLSTHIKQHNKVKSHACEICGKCFHQTPQLARHMNTHTGKRPYKCDYCKASFADPSTCIKHKRTHTNERPYKCEKCGKDFAYSNVLKLHLQTHLGVRPYNCSHCDRTFTQLHHKKSHEKNHFLTYKG